MNLKNVDTILETIKNQVESDEKLSDFGLKFINNVIEELGDRKLNSIEIQRLDTIESILLKAHFYMSL